MEKIYLFLAEGFEEIEAFTVVDLLRRAEIDITTVSITGQTEVKGSHGIPVLADELFQEEQYTDCKGMILPGGMPGTEHLKNHEGLRRVLTAHMKAEKLTGAICAAPTILADLDLISGRCVTCYPGMERKLYDAAPVSSEVVIEGNLITSKGVGTAIPFALALIESIVGTEQSQKIQKEIVFL